MIYSQVKEPGTDVTLESDITPKKQSGLANGDRRPNLSGTMTGLIGKREKGGAVGLFAFAGKNRHRTKKEEDPRWN